MRLRQLRRVIPEEVGADVGFTGIIVGHGMDAKVGVMATEANPNVLKLLIKFRLFMFLWF